MTITSTKALIAASVSVLAITAGSMFGGFVIGASTVEPETVTKEVAHVETTNMAGQEILFGRGSSSFVDACDQGDEWVCGTRLVQDASGPGIPHGERTLMVVRESCYPQHELELHAEAWLASANPAYGSVQLIQSWDVCGERRTAEALR